MVMSPVDRFRRPGYGPHPCNTNIATVAAAMTPAAIHPNTRWARVATNGPISWRRDATTIIATMIGTEITPFRTALQKSALIGSIGD